MQGTLDTRQINIVCPSSVRVFHPINTGAPSKDYVCGGSLKLIFFSKARTIVWLNKNPKAEIHSVFLMKYNIFPTQTSLEKSKENIIKSMWFV